MGDGKYKEVIAELRKMPSPQSVDYLISTYPISSDNYWVAVDIASHLSWKKGDQIRLAEYYLQKIPYANSRVYEVFAALMSVGLLVKAIRAHMPSSKSDRDLLAYHLQPVLERAAKSDADHELIRSLLAEVRQ